MAKRPSSQGLEDKFLSELDALAEHSDKLINNGKLRERLGWEDEQYHEVRIKLIRDGILTVGQGRGGSVGLKNTLKKRPLTLFISYSHADEQARIDLEKHLQPLHRNGYINSWHDGKILAGDKWDQSIFKNLEKSDIILMIISIDFINSKYCYDKEMTFALEKERQKLSRVIPIIYRNCVWHGTTPFGELQALPKEGRPITSWINQDDAYVDVVQGIMKAVNEMRGTE